MSIEQLGEVIRYTVDAEAVWKRSEFPHPLITLDYDKDDKIIAVSVIVPRNISDSERS